MRLYFKKNYMNSKPRGIIIIGGRSINKTAAMETLKKQGAQNFPDTFTSADLAAAIRHMAEAARKASLSVQELADRHAAAAKATHAMIGEPRSVIPPSFYQNKARRRR